MAINEGQNMYGVLAVWFCHRKT